jgi:hypothetical protein
VASAAVGWVVIVGIPTQDATTNSRDRGRAGGTGHRVAGIVFCAPRRCIFSKENHYINIQGDGCRRDFTAAGPNKLDYGPLIDRRGGKAGLVLCLLASAAFRHVPRGL